MLIKLKGVRLPLFYSNLHVQQVARHIGSGRCSPYIHYAQDTRLYEFNLHLHFQPAQI
jgi:hypothetical protein